MRIRHLKWAPASKGQEEYGFWSAVTLANTFPVSVFLSFQSWWGLDHDPLDSYPWDKTQDSEGGREVGSGRVWGSNETLTRMGL